MAYVWSVSVCLFILYVAYIEHAMYNVELLAKLEKQEDFRCSHAKIEKQVYGCICGTAHCSYQSNFDRI